jgi:hypothetical protein
MTTQPQKNTGGGARGYEQPAVPTSAAPPAPRIRETWAAIVTTPAFDKPSGIYFGVGYSIDKNQSLQQVVIVNLLEIFFPIDGIPPGTKITGMLGEPNSAGLPSIYTMWDPTPYRKFRLKEKRIEDQADPNYGKIAQVFQGSHYQDPKDDNAKWEDLLDFPFGTTDSPKILAGSGTTADTTSWNIKEGKPLMLRLFRPAIDAANKKVIMFYRDATFTTLGAVVDVTAETEVDLNTGTSCP